MGPLERLERVAGPGPSFEDAGGLGEDDKPGYQLSRFDHRFVAVLQPFDPAQGAREELVRLVFDLVLDPVFLGLVHPGLLGLLE
jgi:hypothetical protein